MIKIDILDALIKIVLVIFSLIGAYFLTLIANGFIDIKSIKELHNDKEDYGDEDYFIKMINKIESK